MYSGTSYESILTTILNLPESNLSYLYQARSAFIVTVYRKREAVWIRRLFFLEGIIDHWDMPFVYCHSFVMPNRPGRRRCAHISDHIRAKRSGFKSSLHKEIAI